MVTAKRPERGRFERVRSFALVLAALLGNAPALRDGFVLDDRVLLTDNPFVRTLSGLGTLLRHELFVASAEPRLVPYYRPLSGLLNWLSFQLFGASAPLQHALNLGLHAAVTLLLFRAIVAQSVRPSIAFGAALLFAVHPATAEAVTYIGGRQDMLGWLVGLAGVLLVGRITSLALAVLLGLAASLLGALCHELFIALSVPLALLVACAQARGARARGAAVVCGGALAVASLFALRSWLGLLDFQTHVDGLWSIARASVGVALRLFRIALLPTDLAVDVTVPLPSLGVTLLVGLAAVAAVALLARSVARRRRAMLGPCLAGVSLIALTAVLHAGVVLKYGIASDRYGYAMLVGLAFAVAAALEAFRPLPAVASPGLLGLLEKWGAVGLALAVLPLTWARSASWLDSTSLQLAMIADRPDDPESWLAEGLMFYAEGEIERAYPRCRAYADARPSSDKANLCVGSWLLLHGRAPEAVSYLRPFALSRPGVSAARRVFLFALLASRRYDELADTLREWSGQFAGAKELAEAEAALVSARQSGAAPVAGEPAR